MCLEKRSSNIARLSRRAKLIFGMMLASGWVCACVLAGQQAGQDTFPSANAACQALISALESNDETALLRVLGPDAKEIVSSGDPAEDKDTRASFVEKYKQMHRLVVEPDGTTALYIGAENWPTPIPLVQKDSVWLFDTAAGKQEILYRRIGKNELIAIQVCRELVDAEKEYYADPHDGEAGRQYATRLFSDPNKHNGLFWAPASGEAESPIGPLLATADSAADAPGQSQRKPFEGYYYRILTRQGAKAPGGARSYIIDGKMTGGFAVLAYPAEYRSSGVMTLIVGQDGIVYEKDLGPRTAETAKRVSAYEHDPTWRKAD